MLSRTLVICTNRSFKLNDHTNQVNSCKNQPSKLLPLANFEVARIKPFRGIGGILVQLIEY